MAYATPVAIAITGAGNADSGLKVIQSVHLGLSTAGTINLRQTSGAGTVLATIVLGAAGSWNATFGDGLRCPSGNWFIENTAGNVTGGVAGQVHG